MTFRESQERHYTELHRTFGNSEKAVASGERAFKIERYERLCGLVSFEDNVTVHEVGFGLLDFPEFLIHRGLIQSSQYSGSEITRTFIESSRGQDEFNLIENDIATSALPEKSDYVFLPGTFYQSAGQSQGEMKKATERSLGNAFASCRRAIIANFVSPHVDFIKPGLFYPPMDWVTSFVSKELSRFFVLDHSSPLFEFSIAIFREPVNRQKYHESVWKKYLP